MTRTPPVRIALLAALAAAALGLAGCKRDAAGPAASDAPIARIAPPAGQAWADVVAVTPEGGYRMGNPDAAIKLVEFGSLTCPHCAEFNKESDAPLRDSFVASGRVSYELRNFVRDAIDATAVMLTRCGPPASYFPLTAQVFAGQPDFFAKVQAAGTPAFNQAMALPDARRFVALGAMSGLTDFFAARGLPRARAEACLADAATADRLAKSTQQASERFAIEGTPTFLINGDNVGTLSWDEMSTRLQALGAR